MPEDREMTSEELFARIAELERDSDAYKRAKAEKDAERLRRMSLRVLMGALVVALMVVAGDLVADYLPSSWTDGADRATRVFLGCAAMALGLASAALAAPFLDKVGGVVFKMLGIDDTATE